MKSSKDSDFNLVFNKNLNESLPSSSWAQGQVTWARMAKNLPHLWSHPQKIQNQKFLLSCKLEDSLSLLRVWIAL